MFFNFTSRCLMTAYIIFPNYMQHNSIIIFIILVPVFFPIRCFYMKLNITGPYGLSYFYPGFGKIRALVGIIVTGKYYFERFSFSSYQPIFIKISKLPNELE